MRGPHTDDHGFTLLEVMFVILVMAVLVSIAVSSYAVSADRSLRVACHENLRILDSAIVLYQQEHHDPPASLGEISQQLAGRGLYATCPDGDVPYLYDSITGQITCQRHPLLP